ncbi:restriction endonuclease [Clostridioides difficile]|nr:restriction endonuclease [Clostridioides difficile]HBF0843071.1 restriction endonuclease [Clostridioides difficile]
MFIPVVDAHMELTPEEFEKYSLDILAEQTKNLENLKIEHNKWIQVSDGNYQIDGYIEFEVMGVKYKTIVECKHYKTSISREKVQVLCGKIQSLGAQKGILISTSNFQSGAIEYAKIHGIALIQLTDADINFATRVRMNVIMQHGRTPYNYGKPYAGVLISKGDLGGITCSYLSRVNDSLEDFLRS